MMPFSTSLTDPSHHGQQSAAPVGEGPACDFLAITGMPRLDVSTAPPPHAARARSQAIPARAVPSRGGIYDREPAGTNLSSSCSQGRGRLLDRRNAVIVDELLL